jgi:hypothetical protein
LTGFFLNAKLLKSVPIPAEGPSCILLPEHGYGYLYFQRWLHRSQLSMADKTQAVVADSFMTSQVSVSVTPYLTAWLNKEYHHLLWSTIQWPRHRYCAGVQRTINFFRPSISANWVLP